MKTNIHTPRLRNITITDPLFGHYVSLVADKIIPYQWDTLNNRVPGAQPSYSLRNFRIAAGLEQGAYQGVIFGDTDVYKWLEALAYCMEAGSALSYAETADAVIDVISRAQQPDGYLNTYFTVAHPEQKWTNLAEGHELYGAGHLIEAAVAYARATGKDRLLTVACRFADLICDRFGAEDGKCHGYPGHQVIELALVKLYSATGERRYLDAARYFLSERGKEPNYLMQEMRAHGGAVLFPELSDYDEKYAQTHAVPAQQRTAEGHAVRAMYMYSAMADVALECGDEDMKTACRAVYDNVTEKRMYVTGGVGSSGHMERFTTDYDLPNDRMYCESCASVGLMMFGQRMAALTHDARYYDAVETALCNTVLAGISAAGDRYFYVNPLEVWPDACLPSTSLSHVKPVRQPWFACACCPPNIARTLASLGQYIYAEDGKSVYVNQFISSGLRTVVEKADVAVSVDSSLLHDGTVKLTVETSAPQPFTVRVRIPPYFRDPVFLLAGKQITPVVENGYAVLAVSREGKQTFTISGTVRPAFVAADAHVRADAGRMALRFGPYVYCLEQADNGALLSNVFVPPDAAVTLAPSKSGLPGELPSLRFSGSRLTQSVKEPGALYGTPAYTLENAELSAVPYALWCNRAPGEMTVWMKARL